MSAILNVDNKIENGEKAVPRYICEEQSYGVSFKLKPKPIVITIDVYGIDGELELTKSEVIERGLNDFLKTQYRLTPDDLEFVGVDVYDKKYAPIEKTYEKQSYIVKYRMECETVSLAIPVDFFNLPKLNDSEIMSVADEELKKCVEVLGDYYFDDINTVELIETPEPSFPFIDECYPEPEHEDWLSDEAMIVHLEELGYNVEDDNGNVSDKLLSEYAKNIAGYKWDRKGVWYK